jgi:tetratricopeptide (TPR) repeat protein
MTANAIHAMRVSAFAIFALGYVTAAPAAQYAVNGLVLGQQISLTSESYRAYDCGPSEDFEDYTLCQRTEPRRTSLGEGVFFSTILHSKNGTVIYLTANLAPVLLDQPSIEREISQLSREIGERPTKLAWLQRGNGLPTSVIAVWGRVDLRTIKIESTQRELIKTERNIGPGLLVDSLGDPVRSAKAGLAVYSIAGGAGYIYSASFDEKGRGHRHYVAADVSQPAIKVFVPALTGILQKERTLARNDYSLWSEVALATRNLSLASSPEIANEEEDKVFARFSSQKLCSHAWSLLPLGTIGTLADRVHWGVSTYGSSTKYPEIRDDIRKFLAAHPDEPFGEFLYYAIGDYEKALAANPNSIIATVIRYSIGFKNFGILLQDSAKSLNIKAPSIEDDPEPINDTLAMLNRLPDLYGNRLLGTLVPDFAVRAAAVQPWFEAVLSDSSSPLQDDAAYHLGWIAFHEGKVNEALTYFGQAMTLGNRDYSGPAVSAVQRIMSQLSPGQQAAIVAANRAFSQQPALWYVAARAAYRKLDFELAIVTGEQGLKALNIQPDLLPRTTDPSMIEETIKKNLPRDTFPDPNLLEIPYIVQASREFVQYDSFVKSVDRAPTDVVVKRAKQTILKYSLLVDRPVAPGSANNDPGPVHRDLRQALRLIDVTLQGVPANPRYASLREWLHYRKVRILTEFDPKKVSDAVMAMQEEYPKSELLNDALAEQIYAEGALMKDVPAAERTFQELLKDFPKGNAVDNAYSWMAIIYRCAHMTDLAKETNIEIIRRFPLTRHARYAAERMLHPDECGLDWDSSN